MSHQPFDQSRPDGDEPLTDADVTSETRFGPRPVPPGHRRPAEPPHSRPSPPHGDVSPDGRRAYPRPSRSAKWIVWGGTGLAAAALTAGTVIAARRIVDLVSGHDDRPTPRPYRPDEAPRPRMHLSMPEEPAEPERPRPPRRNLMQEIESNTATLTNSVDNVMRSVSAAVTGFRSVASQASAIVQEFGEAAELVRDIISPQQPTRGEGRRPFHAAPRDPGTAGAADPDLTDSDQDAPRDHDPRVHRL